MSGFDGRTKGKRFRKPMTGNSNLRERWRFLSADANDVIEGSTPRMKKPPTVSTGAAPSKSRAGNRPRKTPMGYDIDGDGQVDVREMRLGKFLDEMIAKRQRSMPDDTTVPETEIQQMRQQAGKLLIAKEFIERNQGQLWRYGSIFAEKDEEQSAEFIAEHKKFSKLMAFLESAERKRIMRSSRHVRGVINEDPHCDQPSPFERQTWVESVRKVNNASVSKFPLPDLQPKPKEISPWRVHTKDNKGEDEDPALDVLTNQYGAIDVDGDGIIDDDEMKLHLRLQEATLDDPAARQCSVKELRKLQQMAGRKMMARDFVQRNGDKMWLYDMRFKGQSKEDIIDEIASNERFAKEFNKLRAKERVFTLKSSMGVAGCIAQMPLAELPNDPHNATEFRRVRDRTELLMARRELLKPPEHRLAVVLAKTGVVPGTVPSLPFGAVREERRTATPLNRTRSESTIVGLPRIYDTPRRIEPTGSFSVTKWKLEAH